MYDMESSAVKRQREDEETVIHAKKMFRKMRADSQSHTLANCPLALSEYQKANSARRMSDTKLLWQTPYVLQLTKDMKFKTSYKKVSNEMWDDLIEQIQNICIQLNIFNEINWDILIHRISHVELNAWLMLWRRELSWNINTKKKRTDTHKLKVLETLKLQNYAFQNNLKVAITALDQCSLSSNCAFLAINVLIKSLRLWLPVLLFT